MTGEAKVPDMTSDMSRRDFLKQGALVGAAAAALRAAETLGAVAGSQPVSQAASAPAGALPSIKLGDLEVSRLILGSNPFFGYSHRDDLGKKMKEYFTDERIVAVLDDAASHGITAVAAPPYGQWTKLFPKYVEGGGKLRIWLAQMDGATEKMKEDITAAVKVGAKAVFIQGRKVDEQFSRNSFDTVRAWVEHIRTLNVPAGMASHRPDVHLEAQKQKFPVDFYFQCFYNGNSFRDEERQKAVETIAKLEKPVVAYKVLGAGRMPPEVGLAFAFRHLRKTDGVCVGVYPKDDPDQVKEDAELVEKFTKSPPTQPASEPARA